jgi:predicted transcriptional regulator
VSEVSQKQVFQLLSATAAVSRYLHGEEKHVGIWNPLGGLKQGIDSSD